MVACQLCKLKVEGSSPFRSTRTCQVVRWPYNLEISEVESSYSTSEGKFSLFLAIHKRIRTRALIAQLAEAIDLGSIK